MRDTECVSGTWHCTARAQGLPATGTTPLQDIFSHLPLQRGEKKSTYPTALLGKSEQLFAKGSQ